MKRLACIFFLVVCVGKCFALTLPADLVRSLNAQAAELSPIAIQWTEDGRGRHTFLQGRCICCAAEADEAAFDGTTLFWRFENAGQRVLLEMSAEGLRGGEQQVRWMRCEYLDAAGWELPSITSELLHSGCKSVIVQLIDAGATVNGVGPASESGRSLLRVELMGPARFVFLLDPQLGNAICRRQEFVGGKLRAEIDNDDFRPLPGHDLWLPGRSVIRASDKLRELRVVSISEGPIPASRFALRADKPGDLVSDQTVPGGQLNFQIPAAPDTLDFEELMASAGAQPASSYDVRWAVIAPGLLMLIGLGWSLRLVLGRRRA